MALESGTYISDLNPSNPVGATDKVSTLDDHVRLIKSTLQNTFPNIDGEVSATEDELNHLDGVTGTTGTGKLVLDDAPTIADLTVTDSITLPAASVADAALSSNVPLKDAPNTFTDRVTFTSTSSGSAGSSIVLQSASPGITLVEEDAAADEKAWAIARPVNGRLVFSTATDAQIGAVGDTFMAVERSGTTVTEVELNATTLDFNGSATVSGPSRFESTARSMSAPAVRIGESGSTNTAAMLSIVRTGGNPNFVIFNPNSGAEGLFQVSSTVLIGAQTAHDLHFLTNATPRMVIDAAGDVSITGAVRAGTAATSTSSTLEAGQIHHRSSNTTVPSMNAGQWVAVQNTSTSSITLSQGSGVTLELGGTTMTGNRTLLPKGFAFIYFRANGVGVVHGNGVV